MTTIDEDVPCIGCGYDLRTLPRDGACPECGADVSASAEAHERRPIPLVKLRERGLAWMTRVRDALTLATIANVGSMLVGVAYRSPEPPHLDSSGWLVSAAWLTPIVGAFVVSCWAAWRIADLLGPRTRSLCRPAIACVLLGLAMIFLNERWLTFYTDLPWWGVDRVEKWFAPIRFFGVLLLLGWPLATGATLVAGARLFYIGQQRTIGVLLAIAAVVLAIWLGGAVLLLISSMYGLSRIGSGEVMPAMLGPTGSLAVIGAVAAEFLGDLRHGRFEDFLGLVATLALAAVLSWPVYLRRIVDRAIALGELPAPSDHG